MREQSHNTTASIQHPESGFTLVEFAIASLTMMIVLAATFSIMNSTFAGNASAQETLQTQQALRVAINTIAREITIAGTGLPGAITVPNGTGSVPLLRPGLGTVLPTAANNLSIVTPGEAEGPQITGQSASQNTDAVTIVSVNAQSPLWTLTAYSDTVPGTDITFSNNIRSGAQQLFANDVLLFTNINGSVMGCVTDVSTTVDVASFDDADQCGVNQPAAAGGNFLTTMLNPNLSLPPTTAVRINVITYFLTGAGTHGHPALMRAVNAQPAEELIEGVEDLQFTYDLYDFATSTETANLVPASGFALANQIRSVNITIKGRSPRKLQRTNDYYRFGLTSKVTIRNSTFRNRYNGP
jgi:Tfp pilus assembly protein PilW